MAKMAKMKITFKNKRARHCFFSYFYYETPDDGEVVLDFFTGVSEELAAVLHDLKLVDLDKECSLEINFDSVAPSQNRSYKFSSEFVRDKDCVTVIYNIYGNSIRFCDSMLIKFFNKIPDSIYVWVEYFKVDH